MALSLDRVRWQVKDPFTWVNDWGEDVQLTTTSPELLKIMLREAAQRELQRKVASTWADTDASFSGKRVCVDVLCTVLNSSKGLTPLEKGALASTAADAVWTRDRAFRGGYDVQNVCPLCGAAGDTLHHRVWWCPASREARANLPAWVIAEARRAAHTERFWTSGVFPHPGDRWPRPSSLLKAQCTDKDGNDIDDVGHWDISGEVYVDGSCTRHVIKELQRAGSAVVSMGPDGKPRKIIRSLVPAPLPQTPQAAEFAAFMVGFRLLDAVAAIY